jgi:hypothetical protein
MAIAGRVAIVPKGDWSADATYKRLDAVTYNNTLYFAKKDVPAGTATSNTEYWSKSVVGGASAIATTEDAGVVKPDGKSMSVDESGTLSINLDGTTITLDEAKNVIKLADALKDKIGSALQPESIVNNQVTTETGFALDARQANPNIDGSLAKQISDLNGSLNKKADSEQFGRDTLNTWIQTPLRNNKYLSRLYSSFNEAYGSYSGVQLITNDGFVDSDKAFVSSRFGFVPLVLTSTNDLNDVIGNHLIEVVGSKNSPKSGMNFYGFNISWVGNNDYAFQLLVAPNEDLIGGSTKPRMYMRSKNNGTWTGWNVITGTLLS